MQEKILLSCYHERKEKRIMYYIEDYYTDEIITVSDDLKLAIAMAKNYPDCMVTDENDNVYYTNIDLPF